MKDITNFLGKWVLQPELAEYELGQPPQKGSYIVSLLEDRRVQFTMNWVDQSGTSHTLTYAEVADGRWHPYENPAVADEICLTLKGAVLLESVARKDGQTTLIAERHLLSSCQMKVVMAGHLPNGRPYQNISIYHKH